MVPRIIQTSCFFERIVVKPVPPPPPTEGMGERAHLPAKRVKHVRWTAFFPFGVVPHDVDLVFDRPGFQQGFPRLTPDGRPARGDEKNLNSLAEQFPGHFREAKIEANYNADPDGAPVDLRDK